MITEIAKQNGYNLTHATLNNRGHLDSVADQYIDKYYFDNSSKASPYNDLEAGKVNLAFGINADGAEKMCDDTVSIDESHSVISMSITLPSFKQ